MIFKGSARLEVRYCSLPFLFGCREQKRLKRSGCGEVGHVIKNFEHAVIQVNTYSYIFALPSPYNSDLVLGLVDPCKTISLVVYMYTVYIPTFH